MTARELALNILYKIEIGEAYSDTTLNKELSKSDLDVRDKAFTSELVYGVLTWKISIDEIIKRYSSIRMNKISPWILNILRIGIYQITFLDKIPQSAAVNESVNLAKKYGHEASSRFVNAILRKIEKNEMEKLVSYLETKKLKKDEIISILTSHPQWLVDELLNEYDVKFVTELLNANNQKTGITLRTNTLKTTREELIKLLELKGYEPRKDKLPDSIKVTNINSFDTALYTVQDEAAQLASIKLEPQEDENILDACSAPGGKTTYIAQIMNNKGNIDAWDIHEHRVKLVQEVSHRLGINIIHTEVRDASKEYKDCFEKYDRIILDVPCSGIGVIRKKPDIKWTRQLKDIDELVKIQHDILQTCSKYLKKGGTLIYSTCTVLKRENREQVDIFLENNKNFKLIEDVKLFPNVDGTDGFYIAKLVKIDN